MAELGQRLVHLAAHRRAVAERALNALAAVLGTGLFCLGGAGLARSIGTLQDLPLVSTWLVGALLGGAIINLQAMLDNDAGLSHAAPAAAHAQVLLCFVRLDLQDENPALVLSRHIGLVHVVLALLAVDGAVPQLPLLCRPLASGTSGCGSRCGRCKHQLLLGATTCSAASCTAWLRFTSIHDINTRELLSAAPTSAVGLEVGTAVAREGHPPKHLHVRRLLILRRHSATPATPRRLSGSLRSGQRGEARNAPSLRQKFAKLKDTQKSLRS